MKAFKVSRQLEIQTFRLSRDMRFGNTYLRENSMYVAVETLDMDEMKNFYLT